MTTYCDYCNSHPEDTFKKTYSLVKNWFELILNYFIERWTNAFAEGVNNKIKLIKPRAFWFTNFDHFRHAHPSRVCLKPHLIPMSQ